MGKRPEAVVFQLENEVFVIERIFALDRVGGTKS